MSDSPRLPPNSPDAAEATAASAVPWRRASSHSSSPEDHRLEVRAAETRLLYENANTGVAITIVIAVLVVYGAAGSRYA